MGAIHVLELRRETEDVIPDELQPSLELVLGIPLGNATSTCTLKAFDNEQDYTFHYTKYPTRAEGDIVAVHTRLDIGFGFSVQDAMRYYLGRLYGNHVCTAQEFHLAGLYGVSIVMDLQSPSSKGVFLLLELANELGMLAINRAETLTVTGGTVVLDGSFEGINPLSSYRTLTHFRVKPNEQATEVTETT